MPGYRITGHGFGDQPGQVEIEYGDDGETRSQSIRSWSDTFIEIGKSIPDPMGRGIWVNDLVVTRADGKRSEYFELVRTGIPYYGPIRYQDQREASLRRAA